MIKNILSVLVFLFCVLFFYLVGSSYFSKNLESKIKKNRESFSHNLKNKIKGLPILINDTDNVVEFNTGFENENIKIERNFWNLFKRND